MQYNCQTVSIQVGFQRMGRENNWNTLGEDNMAGNSGESDSHTKARSDFGGKVWK